MSLHPGPQNIFSDLSQEPGIVLHRRTATFIFKAQGQEVGFVTRHRAGLWESNSKGHDINQSGFAPASGNGKTETLGYLGHSTCLPGGQGRVLETH